MTTRVQFLGRVREELGDNGPGYVWPEALLQQFLNEGLNQLSLDWPPIRESGLAVYAGQREYGLVDVSGAAIGPGGVIGVEYPAGRRLPMGDTVPQGVGAGSEQCWSQQPTPTGGVNIRLRYAPAANDNMRVRYFGTYLLPTTDGTGLDVGPFQEPLLLWAVCGRALDWLDEQRGKRSGGPTAGRRGAAGNYQRLYEAARKAHKAARGVRKEVLSFEF